MTRRYVRSSHEPCASSAVPTHRWNRRLYARCLALHTLTYDRRNDVFEVAVARGGPHLPGILRHLVDHPARVAVDNHTMLAPMTIAVDGRDGLRTTIRIEHDPDVGARA